jgi:hypothetical protein
VGSDSSPSERKALMFSKIRRGLVLRGCLLSVVVLAVMATPAAGAPWLETSIPGPQESAAWNGRPGQDVSCPSGTSCMAVDDGSAYTWNGAEWTNQALPNPKAGWTELHGVSCSSGTACTVVGRDGDMTHPW